MAFKELFQEHQVLRAGGRIVLRQVGPERDLDAYAALLQRGGGLDGLLYIRKAGVGRNTARGGRGGVKWQSSGSC